MESSAPQNVFFHDSPLPNDMLFIHGNLSDSSWWDPFIHSFNAKHSNRAITLDWIGCGNAPRPQNTSELEIDALADYCLNLVNTKLNNPIIVGHSTGALIALRLARKLNAKELFLIAPVNPLCAKFSPAQKNAIWQMYENPDLRNLGLAKIIHNLDKKSPLFPQFLASMSQCDPLVWKYLPISIENAHFTELGTISCPVNLVLGQQDPFINKTDLDAWRFQLNKHSLFLLDHCGHSPHLEDPDTMKKLFVTVPQWN